MRHPFRQGLANARSLLDPDRCSRPEAAHVGRLAQDRHAVGRQGEDAVDRVLHAHRLVADDLGHQLQRVLHLLLEIDLGERKLRRRERCLLHGWQVVRVVEDRSVRVGADLEVAPGLAFVHVGVHVADDRMLDVTFGAAKARHRSDVDHLVHRRGQRDARPCHPRHSRAPHPAGDGDCLGFDVAIGRAHAFHTPVLDVDADDLDLRRHVERARGLALLAHQRPRAQRVDHADPGRVETAQDHRLVDVGHQLFHLLRSQHRHRLDAPRVRRGHAPGQLLQTLCGARDLDPA